MSVEVGVTRKSNTIRNFPCTALQSPVVLTSLKDCLVNTTVSTLKSDQVKSDSLLFDLMLYAIHLPFNNVEGI